MEGAPFNFEDKNDDQDGSRNDRSVLYMLIVLGSVILIMGYIALFIDDPWSVFREKEKVVTLVGDQSKLLNQSKSLNNDQLRDSVVKFIEGFYYDQKKGYFDPPSYFAPITKTFYNFHNLTYEGLKAVYLKRMADMKRLDRSWKASSLEFELTDSGIVANYWTTEKYFRPSVRQQQSAEIRYEIMIDKDGKIFSLKEAEIKNFQSYAVLSDTSHRAAPPGSVVTNRPSSTNPVNKDIKTYDVSVVDVIPQFPGGHAQLTKFLQTNLRYPAIAKEKKLQGNVYVSFFVEKDGTLRNIELRQGLGGGCDEEALRVVRSSPLWVPGMLNGSAVTTYYILPVPFVLISNQ